MKSTNKSKKRRANVHRNTPLVAVLIVVRLFAFLPPSPIEPVPASYASEVNVLEVRNYTIRAAVEGATAGDIRVAAGVYNMVIGTAGLRLHASQARIRANEDYQNMRWSGAAVALDRAMVIAISGPPPRLTPSLLDDLPVHNHWERSPRKRSRRRNRANGTLHLRKVVLSMMHVKQRHSRV
jgi:hypothetical protein